MRFLAFGYVPSHSYLLEKNWVAVISKFGKPTFFPYYCTLKTLPIRCCILRILFQFQFNFTSNPLTVNYWEIYSRLQKKKVIAVIGNFSDLGIFARDPIGLKSKTSVVYWIQTFATSGAWGPSYQEQKAEHNRWKHLVVLYSICNKNFF